MEPLATSHVTGANVLSKAALSLQKMRWPPGVSVSTEVKAEMAHPGPQGLVGPPPFLVE